MWLSLAKLEFKKGFIYYLLIYFFFFFWAIFTLILLFLYINITHLSKIISEKNELIIAYYQNKNMTKEFKLKDFFQRFAFVKSIEIISPKEVYEQLKDEIPVANFSKNEIIQFFPYLIKIKLSPDKVDIIKKEIDYLKKISSISLEILAEPSPSLFGLSAWNYFNQTLLILLILWHFFYLLFFYFLNKNLNNFLKDQIEIFQLLGGDRIKLKLVRLSLLLIPLSFLSLLSFFLYYLMATKFISFFPLFKFVPNMHNLNIFLLFLFYFLFIIFLYPLLIIFSFYKKA